VEEVSPSLWTLRTGHSYRTEGITPPRPSVTRLAQLNQDDKPVLIYSTCPSAAEAERIGGALVDHGLAACVNILPGMTSIYVWEGKRQRDTEAAMVIKTRSHLADAAITEARKLHPYSNPAFVVLPIDGGSDDFLGWIMAQTAKPV
jgi:periplasmic divalent cation tolerance protein